MNILTFDIEEWWLYEKYVNESRESYLPRINSYLDQILDILKEHEIQATFFILGKVAETNPDVVKKIVKSGHHIGCHSYSHKFWGNSTIGEFREDTRKAIDLIENVAGCKVDAYRAPSFSVNDSNSWIFEVLSENKIVYDCSVYPAKRSFGGFDSFSNEGPTLIEINGNTIKEFPVSIISVLNKKIAYSGGGYFRLFPYWIMKSVIEKSEYVMTYFHIYNFDYEQKKHFNSFNGEPAIVRYFKNYYGLDSAFKKFKMLINDFNFVSVKDADLLIDWNSVKRIKL